MTRGSQHPGSRSGVADNKHGGTMRIGKIAAIAGAAAMAATALGATTATSASPASSGDTITLLLEPAAPYQAYKPHTFVMTEGPLGKITRMHWSSWSRTSAWGSGTLKVPEAGIREHATVHLYRERHLKMSAGYFTQLTLSAVGAGGKWKWHWYSPQSGEWIRGSH